MSISNNGHIICDVCNNFCLFEAREFRLDIFENTLHSCSPECKELIQSIKTKDEAILKLNDKSIIRRSIEGMK